MAPGPAHTASSRGPQSPRRSWPCCSIADRLNPLAITTALQGAGGFGKTTLAAAMCHDDDVVTGFDDGILWATLGERPNVQQELTRLYAALTGERPTFVDAEDASIELAARLEDKNCLIVVDDVWDPNDVEAVPARRPFLCPPDHHAPPAGASPT